MPSIDIISEPDYTCSQPAYNCVKYCFLCNNYISVAGTYATFTVELNPATLSYPYSLDFEVASQIYQTVAGVDWEYNEIGSDALSPTIWALRLKNALESNSYLFNLFSFALSGGSDEILTATAREKGVISNFTFDYTNLAPISNSETNGTNIETLEEFRLVIELWECVNGAPITKITEQAYVPDEDGNFCINIGESVAPLLETTFVHDQPLAFWYIDETISKQVCLRYGELYNDGLSDCDVSTKTFYKSTPIRIFNGAFDRSEQVDKIDDVCKTEWMSNMPDFTEVCENSTIYLWADISSFVFGVGSQYYHPYYEIFYTDGTSEFKFGLVLNDADFVAINQGYYPISIVKNPAKTVDYWKAMIVKLDASSAPPAVIQTWGSKYLKLVPCCNELIEFYFLNEYGGYDTIMFTQVDSVVLETENTIFESYLDACEADSLRGGMDIINHIATDVYRATSKFVDSYQSRMWVREFLSSPKKYVKHELQNEDAKISKVIAITNATQYYSKDDNSIILSIEYMFNERINLQKN